MSGPVVMKSMGLAGWPSDGSEGQYLRAYNPNGGPPQHPGRGLIEWTADINEAIWFPDLAAGMAEWKRQSTNVPLRPDGRPNRPLTAYTVTFVSPTSQTNLPEETPA